MNILALVHATLSYENTKPSANSKEFKLNNLRAVSSAIMAFIASGIVATALTYADKVQAALYYGKKGSDVAKLQAALGKITIDGVFGYETLARLKSYQAKNGLVVDGIAGSATLSSLGLSNSPQNSLDQSLGVLQEQTQPEKYGRLHLINDTPYMAIVSLYEPKEKEPSRYAYISPYAERKLLDTYSSSWQISFNKHGKVLIADLIAEKNFEHKNNVFKINLSDLDKKDVLSASGRSKALKAELVNYQEVTRREDGALKFLMIAVREGQEALEQGGKLITAAYKNAVDEAVAGLKRQADDFVQSIKKSYLNLKEPIRLTNVMQDMQDNTDYIVKEWIATAIAKNPAQSSDILNEALKSSYQQFKSEGVIYEELAVFKKRFEKFLSELPPDCQPLLNSISGTLSDDVARLVQAGYQKIAEMEEAASLAIPKSKSAQNLSNPLVYWTQKRSSNVAVQRILESCNQNTAANPRLIVTNFSTQSHTNSRKC